VKQRFELMKVERMTLKLLPPCEHQGYLAANAARLADASASGVRAGPTQQMGGLSC
jgi:hypothetical protein